jgi:hypothetical protein
MFLLLISSSMRKRVLKDPEIPGWKGKNMNYSLVALIPPHGHYPPRSPTKGGPSGTSGLHGDTAGDDMASLNHDMRHSLPPCPPHSPWSAVKTQF